MNTTEWTAHPEEKEVLIQDGQPFLVLKIIDDYEI